jgi:hypothetical protein
VSKSDDVAVPLVEVDGRPDEEERRVAGLGVRVELRPEWMTFAGVGVQQDYRRLRSEGLTDVGYRRRAGLVEVDARHVGQD